jgi:hypothetical protein
MNAPRQRRVPRWMNPYRREWVIVACALAIAGCTPLTGRPDSVYPAGRSAIGSPACTEDTEAASRAGPPSECARTTPALPEDPRIERRKHWLSVGIVTVALYFMARAWFKNDAADKIRIPGAGPPTDPCADPFFSNRPPWCDPADAYAY